MCQKCDELFKNGFVSGDHTCLVYDTMEDYRYCAGQYILDGLIKDELIICVIDEYSEENLFADLKVLGVDVENYLEKGQLIISSIKNTYRGTNSFQPDDTLQYWIDLVGKNKDRKGIRIMGEATFALDGKYETLEKLIEYEIRVNIDLIPLFKNQQYLCVYNKNLYPASVLKSIIRAHKSYINGREYSHQNTFFIMPEENIKIHKEETVLYDQFKIMENSVKINLERELRTDQVRFHYILGCIGDGVWDYNCIKKTVSISDDIKSKLLKIKESSDKEIQASAIKNWIHPEDWNNFKLEMEKHESNLIKEIRMEVRFCVGKNKWQWYECRGKAIGKSENGQVTRIVGTLVNIQDRKQLEQERKENSELLEKKVMERTDQLLQVNKELEAFSHSVSHDLRAPLRSIDGFSKALLTEYEDQLAGNGDHYIERIRNSTAKMNQLINDLLNLSRLNQSTMNIKEVNLSALVEKFAEIYKETNRDRNIEFIIKPNVIANCDEGLIGIVLENLLNNSCKFTQKHYTAKIEFGTIRNETEDIFYVKDDGAGFDMEFSNKLFGVFQRLHRVDEFEGNGIGLANVQRVIFRHGGRVWAESEVEKGATFYFTLGKEHI